MNNRQIFAAVVGVLVMFGAYYIKFILPIAKLKREHPEIFATNPPNAVIGGLSGTVILLVVLVVTVAVIVMLQSKG